MYPKISIIVPVYKVESYLKKCIDSILAQTFSNFELILVDDGSPDNCGAICDEYGLRDNRVKVIHKDNGGISDARNRGLDTAIGDYIGFVDSDDWIEPDMYELLYDISITHGCDIANCTSTIYFKDQTIINGPFPLTIHDRHEAMSAMLEGKLYDEVVWTKLIKRSLLQNIRFTPGIMYEDTEFTYKVIHLSEKICCIGAPKYHYLKRENSIMDLAVKNVSTDGVFIYNDMYKFVAKYYPDLREIVTLKLANAALVILNAITLSQSYTERKKEYNEVAEILNGYTKSIVKSVHYPIKVKLLLIATYIHPIFYKLIVNVNSICRK